MKPIFTCLVNIILIIFHKNMIQLLTLVILRLLDQSRYVVSWYFLIPLISNKPQKIQLVLKRCVFFVLLLHCLLDQLLHLTYFSWSFLQRQKMRIYGWVEVDDILSLVNLTETALTIVSLWNNLIDLNSSSYLSPNLILLTLIFNNFHILFNPRMNLHTSSSFVLSHHITPISHMIKKIKSIANDLQSIINNFNSWAVQSIAIETFCSLYSIQLK